MESDIGKWITERLSVNLKEFNSINPCGLDVKACNLSKYIDIEQSRLVSVLKETYQNMLKNK